mgnify:CR=1 FL=1
MNPHVKMAFDTLSHFSEFGCAVGIAFDNGHPKYSHFTYPAAFLEAYYEADMALRDATLQFGLTQNGISNWRQLEENGWDDTSFKLAREFGIEDGTCFAVEVEGKKSIASISHRRDRPPQQTVLDRCMDALQLATLSAVQERRCPTYSQCTMEYLEAVASGGSLNDVAEHLGLSYHGARARRINAHREIGAKNDAHAIVIAIREGAFSPYRIV